DGNDRLTGNGSRNILVGGMGRDTLTAGRDDDILIGGTYAYSEDLDSVAAALAVWKSAATYNQRLSNLRAGTDAAAADTLFAMTSATILDDHEVDQLFGDQGQDWFWAVAQDITDKKGNETMN